MSVPSSSKYDRPWECRMDAFRVAGELWFVGNTSGASWLLETPEGPVLFDTNYPTLAPLLLESIREAGFDPRQLRAIFHTHGHYDHYGATKELKELSGAECFMSRVDTEMLRQRPELGLAALGKYLFPEPPAIDRELEDGEVVTIGGIPIRCVLCPGHTPGAMSFFFPVTEGGKTYTAGLHGGSGLNTLTDAFSREYGVDWRPLFRRGMEKMGRESPDIFLANHTKVCHTAEKYARLGKGPNPFINASHWHSFLRQLQEDFDKMEQAEGARKEN